MKILKGIIVFLGIIFLVLALSSWAIFSVIKNIKIKDLVEDEIEQELGINVSIERLKFSVFLTHVWAEGITIFNPSGFKETELAYLPSLHLIWDLGDMLIRKKPNIYLVFIDLERLNIIKNKQGKVNIKELMPIKNEDASLKDPTPFSFDILMLSIGKVTYTDQTAAHEKIHTYTIDMKKETFVNLKDENEVIRLVISKAIQNTDIGKLIHLTIAPVLSGVSGTFDAAWSTAKTGAKSAWEIATMPFKLLFSK